MHILNKKLDSKRGLCNRDVKIIMLIYFILTMEFRQRPLHCCVNKNNIQIKKVSKQKWEFFSEYFTYSGGDPRKLNDVKVISTRWPGPARNIYKHCREWFDGLLIAGAANVPFWGPPGRDTKVWSHSVCINMNNNNDNNSSSGSHNEKNKTFNWDWMKRIGHCWMVYEYMWKSF